MTAWGPFETLGAGFQAVVFGGAVVLLCGSGSYIARQNKIMKATGGPGIVPFELAGTTEAAWTCMRRWGPNGCEAARRQLRVDFAFLVGYGVALAVLLASPAREIGARSWTGIGQLARLTGWLALLAGALDATENVFLLAVLRHAKVGADLGSAPTVAALCARAKFLLVATAVALLLLVVFPLVVPMREAVSATR